MDFTLYTMGDVEILRAALAGVAMVFSPDGFFTSSEGFGLGAMAGLGLLIALLTALVMGVARQRVEVGQFIVLVAVFFVMFVPKVRVQVEDYYSSGQIAAVDNVPIGVAFPAAFISGVTRAVNDRMAAGYQTVVGSPYVEMTSPLKLLNGMRNAFTGQANVIGGTRLRQTIQDYAIFCMAGRPELESVGWDSVTLKTGLIDGIRKINTNGLSLNYLDDPMGVLVPCQELRDVIANALTAFYGSDFERVLNGNMSSTTVVRNGQAQPTTIEDYETAFKAVTNGAADSAQKFALFQAFNPAVLSGLNCATYVADKQELAKCLPMLHAANSWAEDQAAGATSFQRIMFHSMNLLLFMFICMAPVVAIMMLVKGWAGLRVAGGYLLFGAWSQSWFIGATIVNFYIQQTLLYEINANGGIDGFTYAMQGALFGVIRDKMALAGNMIASTPLMMMAIMGGSAYGLVNLASRAGGADYYDEKIQTPAYEQTAALASRMSMAQMGYGTGVQDTRYAAGASVSLRDAVSWRESQGIASEQRLSEDYHRGISNLLAKSVGTEKEASLRTTLAERIGEENADRLLASARAGKAAGVTQRGASTEKSDMQELHNVRIDSSLGVDGKKGGRGVIPGTSVPAGGAVSVGAQMGTQDSQTETHQRGSAAETSADERTSREASTGHERAAAVTNGLSWDQARSVGQALHEKYGEDWKKEFGSRESEMASYIERASNERSLEEIYGGQRTVESSQMINALVRDHETADHLREASWIASTTGAHAEEYRAIRKAVAAEYGRAIAGSDPQASEALFDFVALDRFGARYNDSAAQGAYTAAAYDLFGMQRERRGALTALGARTNEGIAAAAVEGRTAVEPQRQKMGPPGGGRVPRSASDAEAAMRVRQAKAQSGVDRVYWDEVRADKMKQLRGVREMHAQGADKKPESTRENVANGVNAGGNAVAATLTEVARKAGLGDK